MPTVQVTATVEVAEGTTLAALEDVVARALNTAGRQLMAQAMPILEEGALTRAGGLASGRSPLRAHPVRGGPVPPVEGEDRFRLHPSPGPGPRPSAEPEPVPLPGRGVRLLRPDAPVPPGSHRAVAAPADPDRPPPGVARGQDRRVQGPSAVGTDAPDAVRGRGPPPFRRSAPDGGAGGRRHRGPVPGRAGRGQAPHLVRGQTGSPLRHRAPPAEGVPAAQRSLRSRAG